MPQKRTTIKNFNKFRCHSRFVFVVKVLSSLSQLLPKQELAGRTVIEETKEKLSRLVYRETSWGGGYPTHACLRHAVWWPKMVRGKNRGGHPHYDIFAGEGGVPTPCLSPSFFVVIFTSSSHPGYYFHHEYYRSLFAKHLR